MLPDRASLSINIYSKLPIDAQSTNTMWLERLLSLSSSIYLLILFNLVNTADISNIVHEETRLMRTLLNETNYLKKVRPLHTVVVDIRFVFNQIVSMVEKEQIIVSNCFVDQKWTGRDWWLTFIGNTSQLDPRLTWKPSEFSNITWIRIAATSVW